MTTCSRKIKVKKQFLAFYEIALRFGNMLQSLLSHFNTMLLQFSQEIAQKIYKIFSANHEFFMKIAIRGNHVSPK